MLSKGRISSVRFFMMIGVSCLPVGAWAETVGATVPWTTYKAEAGTTNGQKLTSRTFFEMACEAVNHTCVQLSAKGQYVTWRVTKPANALVLRACVPDAPEGGGADYTVSVAVNGAFRQKLQLTSRFAWLYGPGESANENAPAARQPHAYFDETRALLTGAPLKPGDSVSIYKDASDTVPWCAIDLLDLEAVAPPLAIPDGFLSVADFGAVPDDGQDDLAAFNACLAKAKAESKGVWIPPGTFHQTAPLELDHVRVRGAGPWFTHLTALGRPKPNVFAGNVGFHLAGGDVEVAGLSVDGTVTRRSTDDIQHGVSGRADRFRLEDLWISHTQTGMWIGPCSAGVIRRCRFRDTFADGLNVNGHAVDTLVEECHSRGNGDDGLAIFSSSEKLGAEGACRSITLRHNTCEAQRWGNGLGVYGGENILVEQNLVVSANRCSGLTVSTGYNSWPGNGIAIRGNTFVDCGGTAYKQQWGAIYLYVPGADLKGVSVTGNVIQSAPFDGVKIVAGAGKGSLEATVADNTITAPGGHGIFIHEAVHGAITIKGNKITHIAPGKEKLLNQAKPAQIAVRSDLK